MIDFDKIKKDKIAIHYFPNEEKMNADPTFILYINSGLIHFKDAKRFVGTDKEILSKICSGLERKVFMRIRKTFMKFVEDHPEMNYHVYYDDATDFYYFVGFKGRDLVVRCKLSNKSNGRITDFFTQASQECKGNSKEGTLTYFKHSLGRTKVDVPELLEQSVSDISIQALSEMMSKGTVREILDAIKDMEYLLMVNIENGMSTELDEETLILKVGDFFCGGIITKALQTAFLVSTNNNDMQNFNSRCGVCFDETNQLYTPKREAFRGKIWIIDLSNDIREGYDGYENDQKAKALYTKKV